MKFVIHQGKRKAAKVEGEKLPVELYHLRANGSPLMMRCIQVIKLNNLSYIIFCRLEI